MIKKKDLLPIAGAALEYAEHKLKQGRALAIFKFGPSLMGIPKVRSCIAAKGERAITLV